MWVYSYRYIEIRAEIAPYHQPVEVAAKGQVQSERQRESDLIISGCASAAVATRSAVDRTESHPICYHRGPFAQAERYTPACPLEKVALAEES